jgi:hypothetical protein
MAETSRERMTNRFAKGALDELERKDRAHVSAEKFSVLVAQMRELGFSEREAPFAAAARAGRGPTTVNGMREHLQATRPHIYQSDEGGLT